MSPVPSGCMPEQEAVEGYVEKERSQYPSSSVVPWTSPFFWSWGKQPLQEGAEAALKALLETLSLSSFLKQIRSYHCCIMSGIFSMKGRREVVVVVVTLGGAAKWQGSNKRELILEGGDSDPPGRSAPLYDQCSWILSSSTSFAIFPAPRLFEYSMKLQHVLNNPVLFVAHCSVI